MSYNTGYIQVPHGSYAEWKSATDGNAYNVDFTYGCQCWDLVALFWFNIGFPQGYPVLSNSLAYTMWNNREQNKAYNGVEYFDLIYDVINIKQGDILVFNYTNSNPYGHTGFADIDYSAWTPDPSQMYEFPILSENNGGTPDPAGGAYTNVHGYDIRLFLGAFRYKNWTPSPPFPGSSSLKRRNRFPWVLYARKLRGM